MKRKLEGWRCGGAVNGGSFVVGQDVFFSLEGLGDSIASDGAGPIATGGGGEGGSAGVQGGTGSWVLGR